MAFDWGNLAAAGVGAGSGIWEGWRNREFQRDVNAQNEALMRESWARDDTAVQRSAADFEAAGLSRTLAAGNSAGNSGPIKLEPLKASHGVAEQAMSAIALKTNIAQTKAQTAKTNAEADAARADAKLKNVEADRVLGSAGYYRTSGNAYDGTAMYSQVAQDSIKAAMAQEARVRNQDAATDQQRADFMSQHTQEFLDLDLRAKREGWSQAQVKTEIMRLTRNILRKDEKWYGAKAISGVIGSATGSVQRAVSTIYNPW